MRASVDAAGVAGGRLPTWPLWILAAPAGVAIWSGWVGLGGMTGFGPVTLLPGISEWQINTAVTLPVGMEVYAAYALRAWLGGSVPARAKEFARWSAIGALVAGAAGQIAYHLMAAAHWESAPWWVTVVVSCVPVAVLGMGAALAHLLREPADQPPVVHVVDEVGQVLAQGGPPPDQPPPDPATDPAPDPVAEPGSADPDPVTEPDPDPVPARPRLKVVGQRRAKTRKVAGKATDPRAGQRVECGCGCGEMVSRMTKKRHEEKATGNEAAG